jgi:tRNA-specific 2-thiouridylase
MRFPLGELTKPQVRALAKEAKLPVASKLESQDLCFLAGTSGARFLARHGAIEDEPGEVVDHRGAVIGRHRGQHQFTVGQRRGLGLSTREPVYVLDKDPAQRRVTVGPRQALETRSVKLRDVRLHRPGARVNRVKLRYRSKPLRARLTDDLEPGRHAKALLELTDTALGPAPGQLACLLDGELVVGWATIARP